MRWIFVTRASLSIALPVLKYINYLLDRGDEVIAIARKNKDEKILDSTGRPLDGRSGFKMFHVKGSIHHGKKPLKFLKIICSDLRYISRIIKWFIRKNNIDVIVLYNPDVLPLLLTILSHKKIIIVYHSAELISFKLQPHYYILEFLLSRFADLLICSEENRARIMKKRYMLNKTPEVLINSAFDLKPKRTGLLRRSLKLNKDDIIVIYQGFILPERSILEIVQAISWLPEHIKGVFIGKNCSKSYFYKIKKFISDVRASHRFFFLDRMPYWDLLNYTADADIGCIFYKNINKNHYYCAPNKLSEYTMCGLAVLGSDFPGLRKEIYENKIGLVANPELPESIYWSLQYLVNNRKLLRIYQNKARTAYQNKYNYDIVVNPLIAKIEEVLKRKIKM